MRALVALYYWPPSGGPGVQRGVKLCRHLRELGIEPEVVTVVPETYRLPGEYAPDPTLEAEVPAEMRVDRIPSGFRAGARRFLSRTRLFRAAWHFDPAPWFERQSGWLGPLTEALLRRIETRRPDVLLTSSQPYTVHLAGRAVRAATGVPWVADFRDPWTLSWGRSWPSRRALAWEQRRESEVLDDADVVIANTPGTRREWADTFPWVDPASIVVVRNGYDEDDFRAEPAAATPGEFRIVHTGSFRARPPGARRRGLRAWVDRGGPEPVPYDLSTHSPEPLIRALAAMGDRAARIRVRLVGEVDPAWGRLTEELAVAARIECVGYRPHRETVAELLGADALWLPTITRRDGGPVSNVPAKTYEYLGSGRPVLSWAGPGDVTDVLQGRARCRGVVPGPHGVEELASLVGDCLDGRGPVATCPDPPDAQEFRRRATARGVASALRRAAGRMDADPAVGQTPGGGTP